MRKYLQSANLEINKLKGELHTQAEAANKVRFEYEAKFHAQNSELDQARIDLEFSRQSKGMDFSELDEARQQISILQDENIELQNTIAQHDLDEEVQRLTKASASSSDHLRTPFIAGPSSSSKMGFADSIPFFSQKKLRAKSRKAAICINQLPQKLQMRVRPFMVSKLMIN